MKIFRKSLSILLSTMLAFSIISVCVSAEANSQSDFTYTTSGSTATITGYTGTETDVVIPETVTDEGVTYSVTAVGENVFCDTATGTGSTVTSIIFPESVVSIGKYACYNNKNLTAVTINGSSVVLNQGFAYKCSNLTTFTINGSVRTLGSAALYQTALISVVFPEGLVEVNDYALNIGSMTSLTLPSTVTTFSGDHVLYASEGVLNGLMIYVPDTATEATVRTGCKATLGLKVGEDTVQTVCPYFKKVTVGDGYESNPGLWPTGDNTVPNRYTGTATKVVIPTYAWNHEAITELTTKINFVEGTVKDIIIPETANLGTLAFKTNTVIEKVTVNSDIVNESVFMGCTALKEAVINGTISANYIFASCTALEKATINTVTADPAPQNIFHTNTALTEITITGMIPDAATATGLIHTATVGSLRKLIITETGGFSGANARTVQFGPAATLITELEVHGTIAKQNCFYGFTALKTVKIYNTASITMSQTFRNCTGVENVIIEEGSTIAAGSCFQGCTGIKSLEVPRNVSFTGWGTFVNCTSIKTVDFKSGVVGSSGTFYGCTGLKAVIMRDGAVSVRFGNTANTNFVTFYMPTWPDGTLLQEACANNRAKSCFVPDSIVLTDEGGDFLTPTSEGYIFAGYVTNLKTSGEEVLYKIDQSQQVNAFRPKFVKPVGGDVNGDGNVTIRDLIRYKKYIANDLEVTGTLGDTGILPFITQFADMNIDGNCTAQDIAAIRQILLGFTDYISEINDRITFAQPFEMMTMAENDTEVTYTTIQEYDEEYAYNHHPHITKFNGVWYVIFSQGYVNEDDLGQRVMYATSEDGETWSFPDVLSDSCYGTIYPDQQTVQFPSGFYNDGEKLYAYYVIKEIDPESVTENGAYDYVTVNNSYYYKELVNGEWSEPIPIEGASGGYENVHYINGYYFTTTATGVRRSIDAIEWTNLGLTGAQVSKAIANGAESLAEGTLYVTDEYMMHLFMRGGDGYIWHSVSTNNGRTWSDAYRTALTNDTSKLDVGRLNDGRYFLVNNPVVNNSARNPLCISISDDGYNFETTYIIKGGEGAGYVLEQPGIAKGGSYAYPSCYVDGNMMYVVYSCGKELIEVASFDISNLL